MPIPSCPKCGNHVFEIGEIPILNATYKHNATVCSTCGCIVAIEELLSVTYMLGKIAEKLGVQFDL